VEDPERKPAVAAGFRGARYISAKASARGEWAPGGSSNPGFDAYATSKQGTLATDLAFARETPRLVTGNSYRNPALQAKMASTVDVLSNGRLTFGIGAGWYEPDYVGYGYDFGSAGDRLRRLGEAVQVILSLWTADATTFEGKHYQLRGAINQPKGVQKPHIPLLIAGGGEKVTLRLVAQYADACNIMDSPEVLRRKYAVLERHCKEVGRDYNTINRTSTTVVIIRDSDAEARALVPPGVEFAFPGDLGSYGLIGTIDTVHQRIAAYAAAGVQELALGFEDPLSVQQVRRFAELFIDPSSPSALTRAA
jgi:alkanesulfonate monooxygenase SsuD/methylene tetrahydromethanopterin reductase-like flavin-dependent oxidoreductase (luciferase family)